VVELHHPLAGPSEVANPNQIGMQGKAGIGRGSSGASSGGLGGYPPGTFDCDRFPSSTVTNHRHEMEEWKHKKGFERSELGGSGGTPPRNVRL
jgi:hypothetical protein